MNLNGLDGLVIFFRWIHVIAACCLVGASFFYIYLLPLGLKDLDSQAREDVLFRCRRGFKMTVHVTLLLFIISGIYNTLRNWPIYTSKPGLMHGLFGMHVLLGLGGITVLMVLTAGRQPKPIHGRMARNTVVALFLAVAVASTLKSAREMARESMLTHTSGASTGSTAR